MSFAPRIRGVLIFFFFFVFCTLPCVLGYTPAGLRYSNWDGMEVCSPVAGLLPASEAEVVYAIRSAAKTGEQLKIVGAGHSFSGIQLTDGNVTNPSGRVMSLDLLSGIIDVRFLDDGSGDAEVTAMAGTRLRDLNSALEARGLAFENLGACAAQSLAGAVATATHGTGRDLGSLSTQVRTRRFFATMGTTPPAHLCSIFADASMYSCEESVSSMPWGIPLISGATIQIRQISLQRRGWDWAQWGSWWRPPSV